MNHFTHLNKLIAAFLLAALSAAALPLPALADDELPPVPTEPAIEPDTELATTESAPELAPDTVVEPLAEATPEAGENDQQESPATESAAEANASVVEAISDPLVELVVLVDLPAETELVVLDESGEILPLASTEAADAMATGDPIWCPVGVAPNAGIGGCSTSYTSLKDLVDAVTAGTFSPATNGVIWITGFSVGGADASSADIVFDGGSLLGGWVTWSNFSISIKGGWSGTPGSTAINISDPSEFNDAINITNWNGDITLSNLLVTEVSTGTALSVDTSKKITLVNMDVKDNIGNGAVLSNTSALSAQNVTLTGTNTFSGNGGDGLTINTLGSIVGTNIVANGNTGYGAVLSNDTAGADLAVTLTGTNEFKFNGGGLQINSRGAVTLKNVYANNNAVNEGATIDNSASTTGAGVTLTGINKFNGNGTFGLEIISKGAISLSKVNANGNGTGAVSGFGAYLDNSGATLPKAITLSTSNSFTDNFDYGLWAVSRGAVTVALLTADRNGGNGAEINNLASLPTSPQNVTLTGASSFNENNGTGLTINTYGTVLLGGVTANDNNVVGALINNSTGTMAKPVTSNGNNHFINNATQGLLIDSLGAITLNNVFADENGSFGVWLNNSTATTAAVIMIKGTSEFNDNGGYGLNIQSKGNITVYNFDVVENGDYGAQLVNNFPSSVGNVSIITTEVSWCNGQISNNGRGLMVTSFGSVNLSHLCSEGNLGEGIRIDNSGAGSAKSVILSGNNSSEDNNETGLVILSRGAITISNLSTAGNGWVDGSDALDGLGTYINNRFPDTSSMQNVTINGSAEFIDNFYSGLEIYTYGATTLSNITADNNGNGEENDLDKRGYGVYLDNQTIGIASPKTISLKGSNTFTGNWDGGLKILGSGSVNIAEIEASLNSGFGAWVTNDYSGASSVFRGGLTISGTGIFQTNDDYGLSTQMWGTITIAKLYASANQSYGAQLASYFGDVNITTSSSTHVNGGYGLAVSALTNIKANNVRAEGNHVWGVSLINDSSSGGISLSGVLRFGYNWDDGLIVVSNKPLSFANIYAYENGINGVSLYSEVSVSLSGNKTFGSNIFDGNGQVGVEIVAPASVTLNNIVAINNGWEGVYIDNTSGPTSGTLKGVTISGTNNFNNNGWDGLSVQSYGAIKANNITANENGGSGAYLDNQMIDNADYLKGITLRGTNTFNDNTGPYAGLDMYSHGNISVNNITSNDNSGGGVVAWNWSYNFYYDKPPVNVTFTGTNTFNNNLLGSDWGTGLYVKTEGAITLSNITANGNEQEGVYLNNGDPNWSWTDPAVTLTGINEFSDNGLNGIYIFSVGNVSLTKVTAELNTQTGVSIDTTGKVSLTCASLNFNEDRGWQIRGLNGITLISVLTYGNTDGDGLNLGGSITTIRTCTLP